jgi:hypothetical protein
VNDREEPVKVTGAGKALQVERRALYPRSTDSATRAPRELSAAGDIRMLALETRNSGPRSDAA